MTDKKPQHSGMFQDLVMYRNRKAKLDQNYRDLSVAKGVGYNISDETIQSAQNAITDNNKQIDQFDRAIKYMDKKMSPNHRKREP